MRNDSHSVVLDRENITRAPTEVTDEGLKSLNQHCSLDDNVERSSDRVATMHLKYL